MNGKQRKKLHQLMKREYKRDIDRIAEANGQFLKPKPRWMPMWMWIRGLKIFIKIK